MRQLGRPALLAATYNVDVVGIAAAAVAELESALVTALDELARVSLSPSGVHRHWCSLRLLGCANPAAHVSSVSCWTPSKIACLLSVHRPPVFISLPLGGSQSELLLHSSLVAALVKPAFIAPLLDLKACCRQGQYAS